MVFLEDAFDARKLCWLGDNAAAVSEESRAELHRHLSRTFATAVPRDALYAKECLQLLAHVSASARGTSDVASFRVRRHHLTARGSMFMTEEGTVQQIEHAIRTGSASNDVYRAYAYHHTHEHLLSCTFTPVPASRVCSPVHANRLQRLLMGFSKEATFKVHGDASLHAELITCMLPPFMPSMMAHLETPFQMVAATYPTQVNDMVRPMLDTPYADRMTNVDWHGDHKIRDVILSLTLLIELIGQRAIVLLTGATLSKELGTTSPLPFVRRTIDGKYQAGVRVSGEFQFFAKTHSVCDIAIEWIQLCREHTIGGTADAAAAILDEYSDVNPLCKYLKRA